MKKISVMSGLDQILVLLNLFNNIIISSNNFLKEVVMKKPLWSLPCFFFLLLSIQITLAQNQIAFGVISGGGEKISNNEYSLIGTVGQPVIGKLTSNTNQKFSGFWYLYSEDVLTAIEDEETIPNSFKLEQNYPNPFNPSTVIKYAVPERSSVLIKVYNIVGEEVAKLVSEEKDQGWYEVTLNSTGLASGIYIYRMTAGNFINTKKMILIK